MKVKPDYICFFLIIFAFLAHYMFQENLEVDLPLPPDRLDTQSELKVAEMPIGPELRSQLNSARAKKYLVRDPQSLFTVTLVDFSKNPHSAHSPDLCMKGSGWEKSVFSSEDTALGKVLVNRFVRGQQTSYLANFFVSGDELYSSPVKFRIESVLRKYNIKNEGSYPFFVIIDFGEVAPVTKAWKDIIQAWFCQEDQSNLAFYDSGVGLKKVDHLAWSNDMLIKKNHKVLTLLEYSTFLLKCL